LRHQPVVIGFGSKRRSFSSGPIVAAKSQDAETPNDIAFSTDECTLGKVLVARSSIGVCAILIGSDVDELKSDLAARFPDGKLISNKSQLRDDLSKVLRFIETPSEGLDLALEMRGTPFQRRVWDALRAIPIGTTVTYTELARRIGEPKSARAVASASVQCDRTGHSMPPGHPDQRRTVRLSVGGRAQAGADQKGGHRMNARLAIVPAASADKSAEARVAKYDWLRLSDELSGSGCAVIEKLSPEECQQIAALYPQGDHFRSHVHMARYGFGKGEYRYFKYPLPELLGWPMTGTAAWASISATQPSTPRS
jgi:O6-methylguanine-DNA--protein-cysteine methyltransferase